MQRIGTPAVSTKVEPRAALFRYPPADGREVVEAMALAESDKARAPWGSDVAIPLLLYKRVDEGKTSRTSSVALRNVPLVRFRKAPVLVD
jgi:hypothetical protein